MRLDQALRSTPLARLREIARRHGETVDSTMLPAELAYRVAAALTLANWTDRAKHLDAPTRDALTLLVGADGTMAEGLLARRLAARHGLDQARAEACVQTILAEGVAYRASLPPGGSLQLIIPTDLLTSVGTAVSLPSALRDAPTIDEVTSGSLTANVFLLMSALRSEGWRAAARRPAGARRASADALLHSLKPASQPWTPVPVDQSWAALLRACRGARLLEPGSLPTPDGQAVIGLLGDERALTEALLRAVARSARRDRAEQLLRDFLGFLAGASPLEWRQADAVLGQAHDELSTADGPRDRHGLLREWALCTLPSLGLIQWGRSQGVWTWIRPTSALLSYVGRDAKPPDTRDGFKCAIRGLAGARQMLCEPSPSILFRLEAYLQIESVTDGRTYAASSASIARGVRLGGSAEDLVGLLTLTLTGADRAAALAEADRLARRATRVRVSTSLAIRSDDPNVVDGARQAFADLLLDPEMGDCGTLYVKEQHLQAVMAGLARDDVVVDLAPSLRLDRNDGDRVGRIGESAVETLWVLATAIRTLDRRALARIPGAEGLMTRLELALTARTREQLQDDADEIARAVRSAARRVAVSQ
ncbi:MAG: hypothetical protein U0821_02405 [Chloroflexota bacterium]